MLVCKKIFAPVLKWMFLIEEQEPHEMLFLSFFAGHCQTWQCGDFFPFFVSAVYLASAISFRILSCVLCIASHLHWKTDDESNGIIPCFSRPLSFQSGGSLLFLLSCHSPLLSHLTGSFHLVNSTSQTTYFWTDCCNKRSNEGENVRIEYL